MAGISYTATIHKFESQGEKTGWTYIEIPADLAQKLKPNNKKSFRVKGKLDQHKIDQVALLPMGGGAFILAINASMRKGTGKNQGAMLKVHLQLDEKAFKFNQDFLDCLADEPRANDFFQTLTGSVQRYFSKWIDEAKTDQTRTRRIAQAISALAKSTSFSELIRSLKQEKP
jgi:hypothetical protein